uniref:Uncharacterized protein n=1 Tax=Ditylenchus dipsaci TaxID=166011 RepID=A0A915ECG6_9BILA
MKKAKENSGVTINSRTNDPSEDDVADDSDKITRIHISSQPESLATHSNPPTKYSQVIFCWMATIKTIPIQERQKN